MMPKMEKKKINGVRFYGGKSPAGTKTPGGDGEMIQKHCRSMLPNHPFNWYKFNLNKLKIYLIENRLQMMAMTKTIQHVRVLFYGVCIREKAITFFVPFRWSRGKTLPIK